MSKAMERLCKRIGVNSCESFSYTFRKPTSWKEAFFNPYTITHVGEGAYTGNSVVKRMQRCLIDNGDFKKVVEKALDPSDADNQKLRDFFDGYSIWSTLDPMYYTESLAGCTFFYFTTSIIQRFAELFFQSAKNVMNFSALHGQYRTLKKLISYGLMGAAIMLPYYCLGYGISDFLCFFFLPLLFENVLPFKWTNFLKQINTLSSTKDFVLKDFIFKNIQATIVRILFIIPSLFSKHPLISPAISFCVFSQTIKRHNVRATNPLEWVAEIMGNILGKIVFDLLYILILKTISENADLRNPMGWMFSKFRVQQQTRPWMLNKLQVSSKEQRPKAAYLAKKNPVQPTEFIQDIERQAFRSESEPDSRSIIDIKKTKIKRKGTNTPAKDTNLPKQKPCERITIEVSWGQIKFQKIESESFQKEVWGVIINKSIEKNTLSRYETSLSNGKTGGAINQLKGVGSDKYELGGGINNRLIGKIYYGNVYDVLQGFMKLEDALPCTQELENICENTNDMGLMIFSREAKTHKDIYRVANSF